MADNEPPRTRVSGNVVVIALAVIILACIGLMGTLAVLGKDSPTVFAMLFGLLGAAVPGVINTLQVQEVKQQTNGNSTRLLDLVDKLSAPAADPSSAGQPREVTSGAAPPTPPGNPNPPPGGLLGRRRPW